jgi:hypothetical protein
VYPDPTSSVVADEIRIWTASRATDEPVWRPEPGDYEQGAPGTGRGALDGIVFDAASREAVEGKVWEGDGWYAFRVELATREFVRGRFLTAKWDR